MKGKLNTEENMAGERGNNQHVLHPTTEDLPPATCHLPPATCIYPATLKATGS